VHGAPAVCIITDDQVPTVSHGDPRPAADIVGRAVATARQAMEDGRDHVTPTAPEIVGVGDGRVGIALVLGPGQRSADAHQRVARDLRRLVASFRVGRQSTTLLRGDPQQALDGALTRLESVEGLATALCEAARAMTGLPAAIALRDPVTHGAAIVAASRVSDHRLIGHRVTAESACGKAIMSRMPVAGATIEELVGGISSDDRRRRDEPGVAFPLHDGREGIGALLVFGQADAIDPALSQRVAALGLELAPHLSSASAARAAETRALVDELTGLPNRRVLERTMGQIGDRPGALLIAQLDHFKKLGDGFGHAATDAALKHLGQVLARTLREGDLAARSGEDEFALWLIGARPPIATDVSLRIRKAIAGAPFAWAGADLPLTCSIGIACYPEPVGDLAELRLLAGAAARRARDAGGDRVEVANPPPPQAGG
jgi:diguanylate cyclase (GGDEF)-like protein